MFKTRNEGFIKIDNFYKKNICDKLNSKNFLILLINLVQQAAQLASMKKY